MGSPRMSPCMAITLLMDCNPHRKVQTVQCTFAMIFGNINWHRGAQFEDRITRTFSVTCPGRLRNKSRPDGNQSRRGRSRGIAWFRNQTRCRREWEPGAMAQRDKILHGFGAVAEGG